MLLVDAVRNVLWISETGDIIFCEQGRAVIQDFSKYEAYCRLGVRMRDTVRRLVRDDVINKHLNLSAYNWVKVHRFVESQEVFISSDGFRSGYKREILYKLFCIIAHDIVPKNSRGQGKTDRVSYKSFEFFSSLFPGGEPSVVEALQKIRIELEIV